MKLTEEMKAYFIRNGYQPCDLQQIERALQVANTKYRLYSDQNGENGKVISRKEAMERLGMEEYLSGLGRSAFHWTSMRECKNGVECIGFDSSGMFR